MASSDPLRPRVAVSSCLLGEAVRYDGTGKRVDWLVEDLGRRVAFVPVCPEVEVGLGVPRPPIRVERQGGSRHIKRLPERLDLTPRFEAWIAQRLQVLGEMGLAGYVFKARSPSCGIRDVPVCDEDGRVLALEDGVFARAVRRRWPDLPVVDEGHLGTEAGCQAFEDQVFAYALRAREET